MQKSPSEQVRPGDLVRVRRRRWRVVDVRAHDTCQVLTLAAVGAPEGTTSNIQRVIAPFDTIERIERPTRLRLVARRRWRRACRALIADHTPPGALRSGRRARIDLLPHQLEPALAIVRGLGSRLLLADDVGLGKTIQAGLVLSELRARATIERALILTPAGLREQWAGELAERFAVTAAIVDAGEMRRRVAALPVGVNPWSTIDVAIASFDYVKRPDIFAAAAACRWDVLIVDEAHGVAGDSGRHEAIAALAACAPYVLLLTATPHCGDRRAFLSLCRLGQHGDRLLLFRRTRLDVRLGAGRRVRRLLVRPSAAELRMHALVTRFSRAALEDQRTDQPQQDASRWLAIAVLNKRALSSARSLAETVERRLAALESNAPHPAGAAIAPWQPVLPLPDPDDDTNDADRAPDLADLALGDPAREYAMLRELAASARQAARHETKIAALIRFLDRVHEPVIVFTEYRDTLVQLRAAIRAPAAVLHGGLDRAERAEALGDFIDGRRAILLATDAAGEGLNLHHTCRIVVTLELPWNPMRLEQRIGRVDRIGQRRTVHALHLIARDTGETRILDRLRMRIAQARADVGAADPLGSHDDDLATARLVIDGAADDGSAPCVPSEPDPHAPIPTVLRVEADAESARLALARRFAIGRPSRSQEDELVGWLEADGAWLSFSRASRLLARTRVLIILKVAYEDATGRPVESMLVPAMIASARTQPPFENRRCVDDVVKSAMANLGPRIELAVGSWRDAALACTRAFVDTRLTRERAIAAIAMTSPTAFQPGLFDHRSTHQHLATQGVVADAGAEISRRLTALEQASCVLARPAQLLLVLAP
jgi:superfamily II DNA or RNA helicase